MRALFTRVGSASARESKVAMRGELFQRDVDHSSQVNGPNVRSEIVPPKGVIKVYALSLIALDIHNVNDFKTEVNKKPRICPKVCHGDVLRLPAPTGQ